MSSVCHLLPCATAMYESQSYLVSLICTGAIILPTPWVALPSLSSAELPVLAGLGRARPWWQLHLAFSSEFPSAGLPWQQPQMDVSL